jgi:hypothetical protein
MWSAIAFPTTSLLKQSMTVAIMWNQVCQPLI